MELKFTDLSDEQKFLVTTNGINFMKAISECFGPEAGITLWDAIADTLGREIKGEIFLSLLGAPPAEIGTISVRSTKPHHHFRSSGDFINIIRIVRTATNGGLKNTKDLVDALDNGMEVKIDCKNIDYGRRVQLIRDLRSFGIVG